MKQCLLKVLVTLFLLNASCLEKEENREEALAIKKYNEGGSV